MAHLKEVHRMSRQDKSAAICSPSIARIAASTARDWSYVDTWLASKFPTDCPVSAFERNQDTLKALLALAAANGAADEKLHLLDRAHAAILDTVEHHNPPHPQTLKVSMLTTLERAMPDEGKAALESPTLLAVQSGTPLAEPEELGRDILRLKSTIFETEQSVARLQSLECHIKREADEAAELLRTWQSDRLRPSPNAAKQNLDLQRRAKSIQARLTESRDRAAPICALPSKGFTHPTIEVIYREEQKFLALSDRKESLDAQISAFEDLSGDPGVSRL